MWTRAAPGHRTLATLSLALLLAACDATSTPPPEETAQGSGSGQNGTRGANGGSPASTLPSAGSGAMPSSGDSFMPQPSVVAHDAGRPAPGVPDAGVIPNVIGVADAGAPQPPDAGTPCMVGPAAVNTCPLPASTCVSSSALMFFENPRCDNGRCISDAKVMRCPNADCNGGVCGSNLTLL